MRICVIFNPAARGNKARRFRKFLNELSQQCALKATTAPGDARRFAHAAVATGYDVIAAAGGDGTVNEVLNGIGDDPDGFAKTRLGVLPLGTVNVFARELKIPLRLEHAWKVLKRARETKIDLGCAEFFEDGKPQQRYFAQLGGAGLDARAIELVSWKLKKSAGPIAYLVAGFQALAEKQPRITVSADGKKLDGELAFRRAMGIGDGHGQQACQPRDAFLRQLIRIARSVEPFVVRPDDRADGLEIVGEAGQGLAGGRVVLDDRALRLVQGIRGGLPFAANRASMR